MKDPIDKACEQMVDMTPTQKAAVLGLITEINRLCREVEKATGKPDKLAVTDYKIHKAREALEAL